MMSDNIHYTNSHVALFLKTHRTIHANWKFRLGIHAQFAFAMCFIWYEDPRSSATGSEVFEPNRTSTPSNTDSGHSGYSNIANKKYKTHNFNILNSPKYLGLILQIFHLQILGQIAEFRGGRFLGHYAASHGHIFLVHFVSSKNNDIKPQINHSVLYSNY